MKLAKYLGRKSSDLLEAEPFKDWGVERMVEDDSDPPFVGYSFKDSGFQVSCDRESENIRSLFLEKESHSGNELSDIPFSFSRDQVLEKLGSPSKSGKSVSHPVLGEFGAWDRFQNNEYTTHVEYRTDSDEIKKITVMRNDVTP